MKNLRNQILIIFLVGFIFNSCENDDSIGENSIDDKIIEPSESLNSYIDTFRFYLENEEENLEDFLCFEFVYPVNIKIDNQVTMTVENLEGMKNVVEYQIDSGTDYGIAFPFQIKFPHIDVQKNIANEQSFNETVQNCNYQPAQDCFDFQYPIQLLVNNEAHTVYSPVQYIQTLDEYNGLEIDIAYPFVVRLENGSLQFIDNAAEFSELLESCNDNQEDLPCYTLDFPVSMIYNQSEIEVDNYEEFMNIFNQYESQNVDIEFDFPYTVVNPNELDEQYTIHDPALLSFYLSDCEKLFFDFDFDFQFEECITGIVYPVQMNVDGEVITFNNLQEHQNYFSDMANGYYDNIEYVYPFNFYLPNQQQYVVDSLHSYLIALYITDCEEFYTQDDD
ncbi:hypothetical protein [Aureivirga marina]|uniref:hypothetical protein n=1 Tax=Aureivirga marina TaxID=1182451 RepID=UPI0018CA7428|nr:hypothetical protein [Aureivirga marina]